MGVTVCAGEDVVGLEIFYEFSWHFRYELLDCNDFILSCHFLPS